MSDNIKKGYFKGRKEEVLLNDLFQKIFEIDMDRRVSVAALR